MSVMTTIGALLPALDLRIAAGPIELRGLGDADLAQLAVVAEGGVHPPEEMPFFFPWTDAPVGELGRNMTQYHWRKRAEFSPAAWTLNLGVWHEGQLVGSQSFETTDFLVTRSGETGSWLGQRHQGQGIGTAMRQAICAFLFDHVGAAEVTSGAFLDNPASLAVSRKVGYRANGVTRLKRRESELARNQRLVLSPEDFVRGPHPIAVEGLAEFRRSIGLVG